MGNHCFRKERCKQEKQVEICKIGGILFIQYTLRITIQFCQASGTIKTSGQSTEVQKLWVTVNEKNKALLTWWKWILMELRWVFASVLEMTEHLDLE
jgi:hypothetical protein